MEDVKHATATVPSSFQENLGRWFLSSSLILKHLKDFYVKEISLGVLIISKTFFFCDKMTNGALRLKD